MSRALADLYQLLVAFVPWQAAVGIVALLGVVAAPFWLEGVRERQIRGYVRRMVRAEPVERDALVATVREMVAEKPSRLPRLVEASRAYGQVALYDWALGELRARDPELAGKIAADGAPPKRRDRDPLEAVVRIEALLDEGLTARAADLCAESRLAWPEDAELAALEERIRRS